MKVFIINLKRSQDRRERMQKALKELAIDYEFFEGVDGLKFSDEEVQSFIDPTNKYPRKFKKGEVGCFLSHYYLFKKISEEKISHALILEDDVLLSKKLPRLLDNLKGKISQGEVVHLYSSFPIKCELETVSRIDKDFLFVKPKEGQFVAGTVAYIITLAAAEKLATALLPMNNVIDDWKFWKEKGYVNDFKIVFPHPIDLSDNYSDIHESYGGVLLRLKKYLIKNKVLFISNFILNKRKKERWKDRTKNILIDNKHPEKLFH